MRFASGHRDLGDPEVVQRPGDHHTEAETDAQSEHRAEQRDDHRLPAHHRTRLRARHARVRAARRSHACVRGRSGPACWRCPSTAMMIANASSVVIRLRKLSSDAPTNVAVLGPAHRLEQRKRLHVLVQRRLSLTLRDTPGAALASTMSSRCVGHVGLHGRERHDVAADQRVGRVDAPDADARPLRSLREVEGARSDRRARSTPSPRSSRRSRCSSCDRRCVAGHHAQRQHAAQVGWGRWPEMLWELPPMSTDVTRTSVTSVSAGSCASDCCRLGAEVRALA